ncbi:hypothetical protein OVS_01815 [Mycoplasma ovis str. Michigan]|uniref:Uncharacterized protein n=1 Tax=Mycoplasma ovis str. Michigan TaxID=1415773 RepID=A0ABM5P1R3_9MOLU|nr:hypothetical protein [Mycoplasma ovis]AHC40248.1 hypothetical protein OVS_01815 [Mycoplasma ovis str. Michigan]
MSISTISKVLAGLATTGGLISTPFVLFNSSANSGQLRKDFQGCTGLLDKQVGQRGNFEQVYLCPTGNEDKLEMIYSEETGGRQKSTKKIKELKQNFETILKQKLILKLEDSTEKTLDWPSLVFSYTNASNNEKTVLNPHEDCKMNTQGGGELFSCNSTTWKVIKKK